MVLNKRNGRRKRASIYDVARDARVSVASVSRFFKGFAGIAPETRARIETSVKRHGYRPHSIARSLKMRFKKSVGLIVARGSRAYFDLFLAEVLAGVSSRATDVGWSVHLTMLNEDTPADYLLGHHTDLVDGSLILDVAVEHRAVKELIRSGHPSLVINHRHPRLPFIGIDNVAGGIAAAHYLFGLGHRQVACITSAHESGRERLKGYLAGLRQQGLKPLATVDCHFLQEEAQRATRQFLTLSKPPTAILVVSDWMAVGVFREARAMGYHITNDLSVLGFDDAIIAETTIPSLTTMRQPLAAVGRRAFEILEESVTQEKPIKSRELVSPELVIRESTRPIN